MINYPIKFISRRGYSLLTGVLVFSLTFPAGAMPYIEGDRPSEVLQAYEEQEQDKAFLRKGRPETPKVENPAPANNLDRLLEPWLKEVLDTTKWSTPPDDLLIELGLMKALDSLDFESIRMLVLQRLQQSHRASELSLKPEQLLDDQTVYWMQTFFVASLALVKLQERSALKYEVEQLFRLAYSQLLLYTSTRSDITESVKNDIIVVIVASAPARTIAPERYAEALNSIDDQVLSDFNYKARNAIDDEYPYAPELGMKKAIAPIVVGGLVGALLFPFLGPLALLTVFGGGAAGHVYQLAKTAPLRKQSREARVKRQEALKAVTQHETKASQFNSVVRRECLVF